MSLEDVGAGLTTPGAALSSYPGPILRLQAIYVQWMCVCVCVCVHASRVIHNRPEAIRQLQDVGQAAVQQAGLGQQGRPTAQ